MSEKQFSALRVFRMLAVPVRLRIVETLAQKGEMNNPDLSLAVGYPVGLWQHLQKMFKVGIVYRKEVGSKEVYYGLDRETMALMAEWFERLAAEEEVSS